MDDYLQLRTFGLFGCILRKFRPENLVGAVGMGQEIIMHGGMPFGRTSERSEVGTKWHPTSRYHKESL